MTTTDYPFPIDKQPTRRDDLPGGVRYRYSFDNGHGASVVRFPGTYGFDSGLWELAVLDAAGHLDYTTPITNDVLGHLAEQDVADLLLQIGSLPAEVAA